mmetsp:Transcript_14701/g.28453  ORF Transcript_14701/g.28453 Transcript_14701/m.28453 type:complete len:303 (+) Transcript_14701:260-1168(+)
MSRTIYVGNLPLDVKERELDDVFYKCGRIVEIDLKLPPRPPGFAFIEFESSYDADEAVKRRDGYDFDGYRLRVEIARGRGGRDRGGRGGGRGGRDRGKPGPRNMDLCVEVMNLPDRCSWQDLKDFMRKAGEVVFADVWTSKRDGLMGIVEFTNRDDMRYCLNKMHETELKNPFDKRNIRIYPYESEPARSRSASPRSRSRSRSPRSRSRSRSPRSRSPRSPRSRSRSPRPRSRSRSYSRSRSRSPPRSRSPAAPAAPPAAQEDNPPAAAPAAEVNEPPAAKDSEPAAAEGGEPAPEPEKPAE